MPRYLSIEDERLELRSDLSPYVHHFTRSRGKRSGYEVLLEILREGILRGSDSTSGFIQGPRRAVCFMDVPYTGLKRVLTSENTARYEPYGVSVNKSYALAHGARPVLYLSRREQRKVEIPRRELWRVVRLEYDFREEGDEVTPIRRSDWTHEREWRVPGNFEVPSNCIVFVDKTSEVRRLIEEIRTHPNEFETKPRAVLPLGLILSCC